jgi:hypothetical protein
MSPKKETMLGGGGSVKRLGFTDGLWGAEIVIFLDVSDFD